MKYLVFKLKLDGEVSLLGTASEPSLDKNVKYVDEDVKLPDYLMDGRTYQMKVMYVSLNSDGNFCRGTVAFYPIPGTEGLDG